MARGMASTAMPALLGSLFALWTLSNAEHYFDAASLAVDQQQKCLMKPHPGQIVSLLRMFGVGYESQADCLENNLVQLGTGEGKSVVLAMAASVLALLGCDVSCACFSQVLSERDYIAFEPLFDVLGVHDHIQYGTFPHLSEKVVNSKGNIRSIAKDLIEKGVKSKGAVSSGRPFALLVDEVDVFFSKDFYGQVYVPACTLTDDTITALVRHIWDNRGGRWRFKNVEASAEYKACCARFKQWAPLIREAAGDMLTDVRRFDSPCYTVKSGKIGYVEQDAVVFNKVYRYCTMFAYCYEHYEKQTITEKSMLDHIGITVRCGNFSYAEVPLMFSSIMGVTGTLKSLSSPEKQIVQGPRFQIKHQTYTPSVFGAKQLNFHPEHEASNDLLLRSRDDFNVTLCEQIAARRYPHSGQKSKPVAVVVFFSDEEELTEFLNCSQMGPMRQEVSDTEATWVQAGTQFISPPTAHHPLKRKRHRQTD